MAVLTWTRCTVFSPRSLTVGLFLALIVQDRAETHDSIMGYLPYEIWAPLAVGVCGACGVGVMAYLLRGLAAIILNACIASLLFAAVVRMGDPDLVAPYDTVVREQAAEYAH